MNKTTIIIGSVALLGVGAYFYFKPKAKGETDTVGAGASLPTDDKETKALKDIATKITESETKPKDKSVDVVPAVTYENIEKALVSLGIDQTRTAQELASPSYKEARRLAGNMKEIDKMSKTEVGRDGIVNDILKKYSELSGERVTRVPIKQFNNQPLNIQPSAKALLTNMTKKINALGYKVLHDYDIEKI